MEVIRHLNWVRKKFFFFKKCFYSFIGRCVEGLQTLTGKPCEVSKMNKDFNMFKKYL